VDAPPPTAELSRYGRAQRALELGGYLALLLLCFSLPGEGKAFCALLCLSVRFLQSIHVVLKPEAPFRSHYCTASGWMNPVLNALLKAR
jgi:hypothetical protein